MNRSAILLTSLILVLMCFGTRGSLPTAAETTTIVVDPYMNGPIEGDPEATFDQCINRWLGNQPKDIPYTWYDYNCDQVVGYLFLFRYFDDEGEEQFSESFEGETSDGMTSLGSYLWPPPTAPPYQFEYSFEVKAYLRCFDPDLSVEPESSGLNVGEKTKINCRLFCAEMPMQSQLQRENIVLKLTGPGTLDKTELQFLNGEAFTTYTATEPGIADIEASYLTCSITGNQERSWWVYANTRIGVGNCFSIDIEYETDPQRFDDLRWGGTAHIDICLDTIDQQIEGYTIPLLRGSATGTQTCWVEVDNPTMTIENIQCPDFVATVNQGSALGGYFGFSVDSDTRLKYDIIEDRGEGAVYTWPHDEAGLSEVPILISLTADRDSECVVEDTTVLGSTYKITARWL